MDNTDRISFSKSSDLAGQNQLLNYPRQVNIEKTINIGRFLADFRSIFGYSGDHWGVIRAFSGGGPGMF